MDYSFNAEVAERYGVEEAIFLHNLYWWIAKNEANGRHYYNGESWTYNSMDAFVKLFPFWSKRQIERIIKKLRDNGAILVGNFNSSTYDRTRWYALHETVKCIYANGEMDVTKRGNGCHQTVKWMSPNGEMYIGTDSKPDINTDSKPDRESAPAHKDYGEFGKVRLSDDEYGKLVQRLGKDSTADYIARLDGWLAEGHSKKNHYATVLNWWRKDGGGKPHGTEGKGTNASFSIAEIEDMMKTNAFIQTGISTERGN